MNKIIYCKTTRKGIQSFYVIVDGIEYYLFEQKYYVGVRDVFSKGVSIDSLSNLVKSGNSAVRRTASKLPVFIKYIEKEYGIGIYNKTNKEKFDKKREFKDKGFNWRNYCYTLDMDIDIA